MLRANGEISLSHVLSHDLSVHLICGTLESITAGILFLSKEVTLPLQAVIFVFANSLDPDQDRQDVGPDLNPTRLTL